MRSVLRMRHYCDHCKKSTGTKPAMLKHEACCTANPDRVCSMCKMVDLEQKPMSELKEAFYLGFKELVAAANYCPACILAAQRQFYRDNQDETWISESRDQGNWSFKEARKDFWKSYNEDHQEYPGY